MSDDTKLVRVPARPAAIEGQVINGDPFKAAWNRIVADHSLDVALELRTLAALIETGRVRGVLTQNTTTRTTMMVTLQLEWIP
jgi:hypothetical protein